MYSRRFKTGYFFLEALHSFATVYYFYYFYFFMQKQYGFGNLANLALAALNGATYAALAWAGGKFAQRFGYFLALKVGFAVMILSLACGLRVASAPGQIVVMVGTVLGMCFTWPTLEALVSEDEPREGLQDMVGIYNVVWAATAAVANFTGGAMLDKLGFLSLFYVPIAILICQLGLTLWLESKAKQVQPNPRYSGRGGALPAGGAATRDLVRTLENPNVLESPASLRPRTGSATGARHFVELPCDIAEVLPQPHLEHSQCPLLNAGRFLRMAWLANPFAYIALNTVIAAMPGVAARLGLSTMLAGFCGSVWSFARLGTFIGLWRWPGWHYRFRWLLLAYLALVGAFTTMLLTPSLALLVSAQTLFGGALGLIYYSSLFYSMDTSDTKGEHGGIHEAAIGLGNFAGPATGAGALYLLPGHPDSGPLAVSVLLLCGLTGLFAIWHTSAENRSSKPEIRTKSEARNLH
jgi:predicted MFS family arabinose efflux permease